jgi:hypothetical protein
VSAGALPKLPDVHAALKQRLRETLRCEDGVRAFELHQLLAIRFTRLSRLSAPSKVKGDGERWRLLLSEHSPRGEEHEHLLWTQWRSGLLKNDAPGPDIAVAHLEPEAHRTFVSPGNKLLLNLESLWDEYEGTVVSLVAACATNEILCERVLTRWAEHDWSVGFVSYPAPDAFALLPASASFTRSIARASGTPPS